MRIYTVHGTLDGPDATGGPYLVKEGFSWPAFLLGPVWALWHRMWLTAGGFLGAYLLVGGVLGLTGANEVAQTAVNLGVAAVMGFLGNDLRRRALAGWGFPERAVVAAEDAEAAGFRYWEAHRPGAVDGSWGGSC